MPQVYNAPPNSPITIDAESFVCYGRDKNLLAVTPNEVVALLLCGLDDILSADAPPIAVRGTLTLLAEVLNSRQVDTKQLWFVDSENRLDYHELTPEPPQYKCRECGEPMRRMGFGSKCTICEALGND